MGFSLQCTPSFYQLMMGHIVCSNDFPECGGTGTGTGTGTGPKSDEMLGGFSSDSSATTEK